MKKILSFLLVLIFINLFSQNLENKISKEICSCLGDLEKVKNPELKSQECIKKSFKENYEEILQKINDPANKKTKDFEDYYISVEATLLNNCATFLDHRKKGLVRNRKESISNCDDLKIGVYYYETLQKKEKSYLTFSKYEVVETRKNNVYTIRKLQWVDKCTYQLSLLETNSNYDDTYLKNKKLNFRIIENSPKYFIVQTEYFENGGLNNVKIFKLPFINDLKPRKAIEAIED